jgi:uncharacterized protein YhhL (DUF1145 family)
MRWNSATTTRRQKVAIGAALIALLWIILAAVAFIPFGRDSSALAIIATGLVVFAAIVTVLLVRRRVDLETGVYAVLTIAALVGAYMVPLRSELPPDALDANRDLSAQHDDRYGYAQALFWRIAESFTGPTREYLLQPLRIFVIKSPAYFWETRGYMPSHLQAQLYRTMLLASGRFEADEVEYQTGRCFNSPHGYVVIYHPQRRVYADLWAAANFDEYRFGQVVDMPSCDGITEEAGPEGEPFNAAG